MYIYIYMRIYINICIAEIYLNIFNEILYFLHCTYTMGSEKSITCRMSGVGGVGGVGGGDMSPWFIREGGFSL